MTIITKGQVWTGAVDELPGEYPDQELFAQPSWRFVQGDVAQLDLIGLIDHHGWLQTASMIGDACQWGAQGLLLRISSMAQEARGSGVAIAALEAANKLIPTAAYLLGDCGGAGLALAQCCRRVDADEGCQVGWDSVAHKYGTGDDLPPADHAAELLGLLIHKRTLGLGSRTYAQLARSLVGLHTESEIQAVLSLLDDTTGPQEPHGAIEP